MSIRPLTMVGEAGKVNSTEKAKPQGMIGIMQKPITATLVKTRGKFYEGIEKRARIRLIVQAMQMSLRVARYFLVLSSMMPVSKEPATPNKMKLIPMIEI